MDGLHAPSLTLSVIWSDVTMIEVAARLRYGDWSGRASAYADFLALQNLSNALSAFAPVLTGVVEWEIGQDDGIGFIGLRLGTVDAARHLRCLVRMSTMESDPRTRPESVARLSIEVGLEPAALDEFLPQLERLAGSLEGEATLALTRP